jgi:CheY-like chemotaxis protein
VNEFVWNPYERSPLGIEPLLTLRGFHFEDFPGIADFIWLNAFFGFYFCLFGFCRGMSKTVLIVEDYADVRAMMRIMVHKYEYDVVEARDGSEALEKAQQFHPDLILMDSAMPVLDGFTAARMIRNFAGFSKTPIIVLSAYGNADYDKAVEAGCNLVINKPIDFKTIKPLLQKYLPL